MRCVMMMSTLRDVYVYAIFGKDTMGNHGFCVHVFLYRTYSTVQINANT